MGGAGGGGGDGGDGGGLRGIEAALGGGGSVRAHRRSGSTPKASVNGDYAQTGDWRGVVALEKEALQPARERQGRLAGGECDAQNAHKMTAFELRKAMNERGSFMGTSFHRWSVRACACACVRVCVCACVRARAIASRGAAPVPARWRALCRARWLQTRSYALRLSPADAAMGSSSAARAWRLVAMICLAMAIHPSSSLTLVNAM